MIIRSFRSASLLVLALAVAPVMSGCVASSPEEAEEIGVADDALSLPSATYGFSESLKFCKKINYVFGSKKVCTPSIRFEGDVTLGEFETFQGIPVSAAVIVDIDKPFHSETSISVGLESGDGKVCYNASKVDGIDLSVCAKPVDRVLDTNGRKLSFRLKLSVEGSAKISGVGISQEVALYTTPTITVPY